ncbi:MAG: tetratricopeptide repeat protein [Rubrivivax sp.]|nr:tetratricopeptide repeat protein [Rubrivivax sp.]
MFAKTSFDTAGYSFNSPGTPPAAAAPALSFDVTEAEFEKAVLERSLEMPVLLDCWAPWCGPCRSLGPVLEKLVQAYGGRFALAKLNTDEAPQISAALQIRSIPLVVLFVGGRPVDQFVGALPEGKIREFLDRHLQPQVSPAEQLRADAAAAPDADTAETLLKNALALEPGHPGATLDLAERRLDRRALDDAQALLAGVPAAARDDRHAALSARLQLALNRPAGDPQALAARIAANARDFDARFDLAALLAHDGDFRAAFDQLLEVVLRDKGEPRERARKQLIEWFNACPDAEAVSYGRRYLGMYLN